MIYLIFPLLFFINCFANVIEPYLHDIEVEESNSGIANIDCVYVINLKNRLSKWKKIQAEFLMHNIKVNRVNAINGWFLKEEEKQTLFGSSPIRMRGGQIGCLLSHLSVIRDAYLRQFNCIWICEDDIMICEDPHQLSSFIHCLNEVCPDWDILYTDVDTKNSSGKRVPSLSSDFRPDEDHWPLEYYTTRIPINHEIDQIRQRFGAYSMIISRSGIKKILNYFTSRFLWTSYDIDIHYIPNIIQFSLNRDLVSVDFTLPSDTEKNN